MAGSIATRSTEANMPEKPAPGQLNTKKHRSSAQPAQFQPIDIPKPAPFRPSKPFSVGKLTLASFNFVFAAIALGLSVGLFTFATYEIITVIIAGITAIVSLLWQLAEYITLGVRHSIYRPIHPGAHVGIHLILWILTAIVTSLCCITLVYDLPEWSANSQCLDSSYGYYSSDNDYIYCDIFNFNSAAQARTYFGLLEALTAFSALMLMCHFTLFVLACIETNKRRKMGKQARVVYLVAKTGPADGRTYYSQIPAPGPGAIESGA